MLFSRLKYLIPQQQSFAIRKKKKKKHQDAISLISLIEEKNIIPFGQILVHFFAS